MLLVEFVAGEWDYILREALDKEVDPLLGISQAWKSMLSHILNQIVDKTYRMIVRAIKFKELQYLPFFFPGSSETPETKPPAQP